MRKLIGSLVLSGAVALGSIAPPALLTGVVLTQTACPETESIASIAKEIEDGASDAILIFQSNGQDTAVIRQVKDYAGKVRVAFEGGNPTDGAQWAARLVTAFELVTNNALAIPDQTVRTVVLVGLAFVKRYIRKMSEKMVEVAPASVQGRGVDVIRDASKKPNWRCRSSVSGQFKSMSFCKENPAQSVVETQ